MSSFRKRLEVNPEGIAISQAWLSSQQLVERVLVRASVRNANISVLSRATLETFSGWLLLSVAGVKAAGGLSSRDDGLVGAETAAWVSSILARNATAQPSLDK